jgi:hypothetical protein
LLRLFGEGRHPKDVIDVAVSIDGRVQTGTGPPAQRLVGLLLVEVSAGVYEDKAVVRLEAGDVGEGTVEDASPSDLLEVAGGSPGVVLIRAELPAPQLLKYLSHRAHGDSSSQSQRPYRDV